MNHILSSLPCIEIPFTGHRFTWRKKKSGLNNILERLDRGIASLSWIAIFPQAKMNHTIFTSSDHCQLILNYLPTTTNKAPPFIFEKMWCLRKNYDVLVKKTWCSQFEGSHMFRLVKKCKLLKEKSKEWNKFQFGNEFRQLRKVDERLKTIQEHLIVNPLNHSLSTKQDLLLCKRDSLLNFSSEYWKQKCKADYLLLGDANTSYYHAHASIRRNRN